VTGPGGRAIAGLSENQFRLSDDGRRQTVATFSHGDVAVTLGLVVDCSASMRPKLALVTEALGRFAEAARPGDDVFLFGFNERVVRPSFAGGAFTSDVAELRATVATLRAAGATALHDALIEAAAHLDQGRPARKALILISDGSDTASQHTAQQAARSVREAGAVVYAIGLSSRPQDQRAYAELARLAHDSGGIAYNLQTVEQIWMALDGIVGDLRNQYVLGFISTKADGSSGRIQVTVNVPGQPDLTVRSRTSYALPSRRP